MKADLTKHTPGKWEPFNHAGENMQSYSQSSGVSVVQTRQLVCGCFSDIVGGEQMAANNAALIAKAPLLIEMAEALRELLDAPKDKDGLSWLEEAIEAIPYPCKVQYRVALERAEAALAKYDEEVKP